MTRENDNSGSATQNGAPVAATDSSSSQSTAASFSSTKAIPVVKSYCITKTKVIKFSFKWRIENFSLCEEKTGEYQESSEFSIGSKGELKWRLQAYPRGSKEESKDYLALFLRLVAPIGTEIPTKLNFTMLSPRSKQTYTVLGTKPDIFDHGCSMGYHEFIKLDDLRDKANVFLPDDSLIISCEGTVFLDRDSISGLFSEPEVHKLKCTLSEDIGSLLENQKFSDVTLSVAGKELLVHKAILAARSPVFAAMFKHELQENEQNRVTIKDIDYNVLREMLLYIYTGKSPNVKNVARNLLIAANKYNVSGLKEICEVALYSTLIVENAVDLLVLADTYSAKQLKTQVIQFINTRVKDVMLTTGWRNIKLYQPSVIGDLFDAVVSK